MTQAWYLTCFVKLERHLDRPPTIRELADWLNRSVGAVHGALESLEAAGKLRRDDAGRFSVVP